MQRPWLKTAAVFVVAAALFGAATARAADPSPFVGNWKLTDVTSGNELTYVLFQVEEKDGKLAGKVLAAPLLPPGATIENFKADGKSMQFDVKFNGVTLAVKGYIEKGDAKTKAVLGSISVNTQVLLAQFTKTDDKELTKQDAVTQTDEAEALQKARGIRNAEDQQKALKELLEKNADKPLAYTAYEALLQSYAKEAPKDDEARTAAEQFIKVAARFGPEVENRALTTACKSLAGGTKVSPSAVEFIRNAEKSLSKDTPLATTGAVLKALASALKKSGKETEAKEMEPRIAKIDEALDVEFEKTAVPFKVAEFKARKGDSQRVAVVELFTGAYCPPCVAADVAFDAALETYKPKDVVLLQYHTHIPAPDRLTNTDTEARLKYYAKEVRGVPTAFLDGKTTKPMGGAKANGEKSYDSLREEINEALGKETTTAVKLNVERKGDKLEINAEVMSPKKPAETVKLRFVLIQEVVRYPGGNGQRLHHHVVRSMPGGADGFALEDVKAKQSVKVDLADLHKSLDEYMTKYNEGPRPFVDDEYPLHLKKLKVVAFIQDDDNKEILQAIQMDVPAAK